MQNTLQDVDQGVCWPWGFSCCRSRCEGRSSASRWTSLCFCLWIQAFAAEGESGGIKYNTWSIGVPTVEKGEIQSKPDATSKYSCDFHSCSSLPCRYLSKLASSMYNSLCLVHFGWSYRWWSVVQGHEARWCVSQNGEVRCGRGAHGQRATVSVNLVVHQTPLLQERMNPEDRQQSHWIHLNSFLAFFWFIQIDS